MKKRGFKKRIGDWKNQIYKYRKVLIFSLILALLSAVANSLVGSYADSVAKVPINDIILDYLPVLDLTYIFVAGFLVLTYSMFLYPLFFNVPKLHVTIAYFSIAGMVRSAFICLTHLKLPADAIPVSFPKLYYFFQHNNDLFFSGHTAMPFLAFLIFKGSKIRYFFLAGSIIMASTSLFMHRHYSIDIFAAYFITYGTFKICEWVSEKTNFKKSRK
jgi:hypothetical protein